MLCSANIAEVFLRYLSLSVDKHVNGSHQNLPNAYNNERTPTSRTKERLPRIPNSTVSRGWRCLWRVSFVHISLHISRTAD